MNDQDKQYCLPAPSVGVSLNSLQIFSTYRHMKSALKNFKECCKERLLSCDLISGQGRI
jgi:hypothetical protein